MIVLKQGGIIPSGRSASADLSVFCVIQITPACCRSRCLVYHGLCHSTLILDCPDNTRPVAKVFVHLTHCRKVFLRYNTWYGGTVNFYNPLLHIQI